MKNHIKTLAVILIATLLFPTLASAQKSGFLVGGEVSIDGGFSNIYTTNISGGTSVTDTSKGVMPFTIELDLRAGYLFNNNLRLELLAGYEHQSNFLGSSTMSANVISLGPQLSYLLKLTDKIHYTPSLMLAAGRVYTTNKVNETTSKTVGLWTFEGNLSLIGFELALNDKFTIGLDIFTFTNTILSIQNEYKDTGIKNIQTRWQGNFVIQPANITLRYYL